jgi:glutamyl-tRNA reductase
MSILVVGLSHRTAPVSLLERVALDGAAVAKLAAGAVGTDHIAEAVVLSTCNRVEVYADVDKFHAGVADLSELLSRHGGVPLDELTPHLYAYYEDRAVQHVFAVACGLDSMVVGEAQILGQIKAVLRGAQDAGTAGRVLNELLQHALRVGKRAHAETGIDRAGHSLVSVGLELGTQAVGGLEGRTALVVGAGSMSALAATTLRRTGVGPLLVANRTYANAERLADTVGGRAVPLEHLGTAIAAADVVVSCTGAVGVVVPADLVADARTARRDRPLFLLDLALPRDIDPEVRELPGCTVVDLDRLSAVLEHHERAVHVESARAIVAEEVTAFLSWQRGATVAPTVVALRSMAADVVDSELTRLAGRLPDLDTRSRDEVALAVRRVVDKLLHAPTVRVKQLAAGPGGHTYADVLRELFDLDPAAVEAVTRADLAADGAGDAPGERS